MDAFLLISVFVIGFVFGNIYSLLGDKGDCRQGFKHIPPPPKRNKHLFKKDDWVSYKVNKSAQFLRECEDGDVEIIDDQFRIIKTKKTNIVKI